MRCTAPLDGQGARGDKLPALAHNYVDFARRNPPLLRLMTGRRKSTWDSGELGELAARSVAQLEAVSREGQASGQVRAGDPKDLTVSAWAQVHGLASLIADGMLEPPDPSAQPAPSAVVATAVDVLFHGLRPTPGSAP